MTPRTIKLLILAGLILHIVSVAATAQMNTQLDDVNKRLSGMGQSFQSHPEQRLSLEQERDTLGARMAWSIAGIILGAIIMVLGPLYEALRRWRAGQLSPRLKRATVALGVGTVLIIICAMAAFSLTARIAAIDADIAAIHEKMGSTPSAVTEEDEITILNLQTEKSDISGRIPILWAGAIIGIAVTGTGFILAWSNRAEFIGAKR